MEQTKRHSTVVRIAYRNEFPRALHSGCWDIKFLKVLHKVRTRKQATTGYVRGCIRGCGNHPIQREYGNKGHDPQKDIRRDQSSLDH